MIDPTNTTLEIGSAGCDTAILGIGSFEQHSAHLPVETDFFFASHASRQTASRLQAVLLNPLPYSTSLEHLGFAGTVTLKPATLAAVVWDIAAWVSYDMAKRASKEGHKFGTGVEEGLIAAETGNNACVAGAMIPVLSLAIPGSAPAAVLLAAMFIHGVRPGPLIMLESPEFVFQVGAMVLLASAAMLILGLSLVKLMVKVLLVPREKLMPIVFTLCVVGAFAIQARVFDVGVMIVFGIIGYYMREMDYPVAPLVLGIILGDILDKNLRRALILSDGAIGPFFTRPICAVIAAITILTIVSKMRWFQLATGAAVRGVKSVLARNKEGAGKK